MLDGLSWVVRLLYNGVKRYNKRMYILCDTREKQPYKTLLKKPTHRCKLDTGDYAISSVRQDKYTDEDLKNSFVVDRKGSPSEFLKNITEKRFWREIERLSKFDRAVILFEFSEADLNAYPRGSGIPRKRWRYLRVRPKFGFSCINKIRDLGIEVVFAGSRLGARKYIEKLIKEYERSI